MRDDAVARARWFLLDERRTLTDSQMRDIATTLCSWNADHRDLVQEIKRLRGELAAVQARVAQKRVPSLDHLLPEWHQGRLTKGETVKFLREELSQLRALREQVHVETELSGRPLTQTRRRHLDRRL